MNIALAKTEKPTNSIQIDQKSQQKVSFLSMVHGELMKITWLRSTWIMLVLLVTGTAAMSLITIQSPIIHHLLLSNPVQYFYEYELSQNLLVFRVLSGFLALMVTAFSVGLEYQQGTIRVILGRGVGRVKFLLSKIAALFLMALLVQLGGLILNGLLVVVVVGVSTGSFTAVGIIFSHCIGTFFKDFLYLIFNMWVSILLATAMTVLGRSLAFGLSAALLWFPIDNFVSGFVPGVLSMFMPFDVALKMTNALLGPSLNILPFAAVSSSISSSGRIFISALTLGAWPTMAIVMVYVLIFLSTAIALIHRRDVL